MKIDGNNNPISQIENKIQQEQKAKTPEKPTAPSASASTSVSLSSKAELASRISAQLEKVPEVRMDKVEAIRAEVEAGTYNRSSEEIAEKMLTSSIYDSAYLS